MANRTVHIFGRGALPKTGQTTEYKAGDDGTYQKGSKASPRFVDNGDGTITDMATGLMWVKDGAGPGCNNGNFLSWDDAINFAENLDFAGYTDWRLPNVEELESIVDFGRVGPSIDPLFENTMVDSYWTSTTYAGYVIFAYFVYFWHGYVDVFFKSGEWPVRPVRVGQ